MTEPQKETPATNPAPDRFCVIGAGPSGLAIAAALKKQGIPYDHFERHSGIGGLWDLDNPGTPMYESAHFISSRKMSGFCDFPMPEDYPDYPRRDQILSYLRSFAATHQLTDDIQFGSTVQSVVPNDHSADVIVGDNQHTYLGVICATGVNWDPTMPQVPGELSGEVRHAASYRSPKEFDGKRVVIVGLGNSGADIACDAARAAAETYVSVRRGYYFIPKHIFGKPADEFSADGPRLPLWLETPIFSLLQKLLVGDLSKYGMPKPDHRILESHPLMNDQLVHHLRHGDVLLKADIERFDGERVVFADGSDVAADLVLFATGYSRRIAYLAEGAVEGTWAASNPLTCFSSKYPTLFTLGYAELNGALFPHLSRLAALIAHVAHAMLHNPSEAERFRSWLATASLDLAGGRHLIDTPRHRHYCDDHALAKATHKAFRHMRWTAP